MNNTFEVLETGLKTLRDTLDSLQSEIKTTKEAIESLEARPSDAGSAVQSLKDHLISEKVELSDMIEALAHGREISDWNNRLIAKCFDNVDNQDVSSKYVKANLGPLLCTFFEQVLLDRMTPMIKDYCKKHKGLSAEDRDKQLDVLRERSRKLELQEEALIDEAEINDQWGFDRREDADPAVVLSLHD